MSSFQQAFTDVSKLVSDFKDNESYYLSPQYQEVEARRDFIDRLFMALGWDVKHDEQKNPYEQEVKVETIVQIAHAQKRADYSFYLAPDFHTVKFFVEAKKPARNLANNKDDFFQTVRYGWNTGTPIAVLTDFEEFIVLDCRFQPKIDDILKAKLLVFHYSDYAKEDKFREIYHLFSREAVADDSLSKYAEALPKPRGKAIKKGLFPGSYISIDEAFLEELDDIRLALARSFKNNDNTLDSDELTEATQRTIDRLVFTRFLEDKLIEPHHYISEFGDRKSAWEDFLFASRTLDAKYNGVVFKKHSIDSRNFVGPDDKTFSGICEELSHKSSPYNFDAIPIHILGSIYERFLGKVVHATAKRANIEEKPEVRKAGGVYYTPQYIVNYIVDNTVGKLIKEKSPRQISKLRFADIACGSGSFLITVFDKLLEHHKKWYQDNPEKAKKDGCLYLDGAWRLTLKQKQKILTNNIYGVDLDQQAVEVTQLSLYLKLLEDETTATANDTWVMFKEQLLPNLNKNIICGNSLIGTDFLDDNLFDFEQEKNIKPMNFEDVFPHIFPSKSKGGPARKISKDSDGPARRSPKDEDGFDAIVGNPPYGATFSKNILEYFKNVYHIQSYQFDSYLLFVERALQILKRKGLLGYIIPNTWMLNLFSNDFRKHIFNNSNLNQIVHYKFYVFKQATVDTETIILKKEKPSNSSKIKVKLIEKDKTDKTYLISQIRFIQAEGQPVNIFTRDEIIPLTLKIKKNPLLDDLTLITQGCKPFQVGKGKPPQSRKIVDEKPFVSEKRINKTFRKLLRGRQINRYTILWNEDYWISFGDWLAEPRYSANYDAEEKIVIRQTGDSLVATLDTNQFIVRDNLYTIIPRSNDTYLKFILAILNSKLLNWYYQNVVNSEKGEALAQVKRGHIAVLPIVNIKNDNQNILNKTLQLVNQMLEAKKQLQQAKTEGDKNYLQRKCERLDKEIDQLVYQLYGLTEEEINIVEKSVE
jgi:adenine-specific DNA-methyltransferase